MTLSYKWLMDYLPVELVTEKLARILNSIGLEVESLTLLKKLKVASKV